MYKLCKTEQSAKRQKEIEKALFKLLETRRFDELSVTELCEYSGIPRKAFYRYFENKNDALYALIEHTLGEYEGFAKTPSQLLNRRLHDEISEYFRFWKSKKKLLDILYRNELLGVLIDISVRFPVEDRVNIRKFMDEPNEKRRALVMKYAFAGLIFIMIDWYKDNFKTPVEEIAAAVCDIMTRPVFPNLRAYGIE